MATNCAPGEKRRKIDKTWYEKGAKLLLSSSQEDWCTYWLPTEKSRLLGKEFENEIEANWQNILESEYEEFDTVSHDTHADKALEILRKNELESHRVKEHSVFCKIPDHSNRETEVVWFGPKKRDEIESHTCTSAFGNVTFFMKRLDGSEGIWRTGDGWVWNYYFVEVVDYRSQKSACHILVTPNKYDDLTSYDPHDKGGPWYHDPWTNRQYWLKTIVRFNGTRGRHDLEFMREVSYSTGIFAKTDRRNICFSPVNHDSCVKNRCTPSRDTLPNLHTRIIIMYLAYFPELDFKPLKKNSVFARFFDSLQSATGSLMHPVMREITEAENVAAKAFLALLEHCLKEGSEGLQSGKLWSIVEDVFRRQSLREVLQSLGEEDAQVREIISDGQWKTAAAATTERDTTLEEIVSKMQVFPRFEPSSSDNSRVKKRNKEIEGEASLKHKKDNLTLSSETTSSYNETFPC